MSARCHRWVGAFLIFEIGGCDVASGEDADTGADASTDAHEVDLDEVGDTDVCDPDGDGERDEREVCNEQESEDGPWTGCGHYRCLTGGAGGESICMDERM